MPTFEIMTVIKPEDRLHLITHAVRSYHDALDRREHGSVACDKAMKEIECILGIGWRFKAQ
jgi:hypothetical protein